MQELLELLSLLLYLIFNPIGIFIITYYCINGIKKKKYLRSSYYSVTKVPFADIKNDKGTYGEYLIYKKLRHFETINGRFLFNVYIPKPDNTTTEIDVLLICSKGIFVIESKNYSGWIHGNENNKNWYQTLPASRGKIQKEEFYNQILQNQSHIKYLKTFIGKEIISHSIIVFSDRCKLKNIDVNSKDIILTNIANVDSVVTLCYEKMPDVLNENDVDELYRVLYPYTQGSDYIKEKHISEINRNTFWGGKYQQLQSKIVLTPNESVDGMRQDIMNTSSIEVDQSTENENKSESVESNISKEPEFICPICRGKLVLRTAQRGAYMGNQFWGCSNYPKCKYILNNNTKSDGF